MDANPILAEAVRGNWVENRHRGAFIIVDADGAVIASGGDAERPVFPRSAIKSMQALAIFDRHAIDRFHHSAEELALACASHHGEDSHVSHVAHFLDRMGLSVADLECGAHMPTNDKAREALRMAGAAPSALHEAIARVLAEAGQPLPVGEIHGGSSTRTCAGAATARLSPGGRCRPTSAVTPSSSNWTVRRGPCT